VHLIGLRARAALLVAIAGVAVLAIAVTASVAGGGGGGSIGNKRQLGSEAKAAEGADEIIGRASEYASVRTAPAATVPAAALIAARQQAAALAVSAGTWTELTNQPYNSDDPNYRDPVTSNSGGGAGLSAGRISALAVDPTNPSLVYAGAADGGVWRSTDRGAHWTPVSDGLDSLSSGALAINPADHSVWYGTGENNTAFENYRGTGLYRSTDGGSSWQKLGGSTFDSSMIGDIQFDGQGNVFVASSSGLFKGSASGTGFVDVLDATKAGFAPLPYGFSFVNSVAIQPGSGGKTIAANMAWRNGAPYNGIYYSRDGGVTWQNQPQNGAINPKKTGRATLAYSADGSKLYAVVEDTQMFNVPQQQNGDSVLDGVFVSPNGDPAGPWNQIADTKKLANSGSALKGSTGYQPGVQAWYNQFLAVDPKNANHVYVGLEETFETTNGGSSWVTIGPYWNFSFPCWQANPDSCPTAPHPDQHAVAVASDGTFYEGNDGGVYSRSTSAPSVVGGNWNNLNATLHTLQYYYAGAGKDPSSKGDIVWGGMQDNGGSELIPGQPAMVEPFGGDGGDTYVDPANGQRALQEYVDGDIFKTTTGGYSPNYTLHAWTEISPSCFAFTYTPSPCDPTFRFIAPFRADSANPNHWVTGGQYVWETTKGFDTTCSASACDWHIVYDAGAGSSITAINANGSTIYAGWCSGSCNPAQSSSTGAGFARGAATNYGGTWHLIGSDLPNRYINQLIVDPANPAHVYAVIGGYSRRWIPNAGVGHVFESKNGGTSFTDVSGNLPDAVATDLLITPKSGKLVVSTDVGVFVTSAATPGTYTRLGGLPNSSVNDLSWGSGQSYIIAATHGRGLWRIATP
jgi:hypothetical protein